MVKDIVAKEKGQLLTLEQFRSPQFLVVHGGLVDVGRRNVFLTVDGNLAIVDTEPLDARDPYFGNVELGINCLKNSFQKKWAL